MQRMELSIRLFLSRLILLLKKKRPCLCIDAISVPLSLLKKTALSAGMIVLLHSALAQGNLTDSIKALLHTNKQDVSTVWLLKKYSKQYKETRADTALLLAQKGYAIAKSIHFLEGEVELLSAMASAYATAGDYTSCLQTLLLALDIAKSMKANEQIADFYHKLGLIFSDMGEYQQSLSFFYKEKEALQNEPNTESNVWNAVDIAENHAELKQFDSTRHYLDEAYIYALQFYKESFPVDFINSLADLNFKLGNNEKALQYYRESLFGKINNSILNSAGSSLGLAKVFKKAGQVDSAIYYAKKSLAISQQYEVPLNTFLCAGILSDLYKESFNIDSAFVYQKLETEVSYQLFNSQKIKNFHNIYFSYWLKEQEMVESAARSKQRLLFYVIIAGILLIMGVLMLVLYFKNREKNIRFQQAVLLEQKQKEQKLLELQHEKAELEMKVLRAQMNPHFIFNVLNSINHFILTRETESASDYLVKFARLMRMVLSITPKNYITLQQELECLELYIQMEQLRFQNYFHYTIHCDASIKKEHIYIPPLLLQPFVENAIWHGLMHKKAEGGELQIEINQKGKTLICTIIDNGIGRKQAASLKGKSAWNKKSMGIQITTNRLQMMNTEKNNEASVHVIDLADNLGTGIGTKVIIQIPVKNHENITA